MCIINTLFKFYFYQIVFKKKCTFFFLNTYCYMFNTIQNLCNINMCANTSIFKFLYFIFKFKANIVFFSFNFYSIENLLYLPFNKLYIYVYTYCFKKYNTLYNLFLYLKISKKILIILDDMVISTILKLITLSNLTFFSYI